MYTTTISSSPLIKVSTSRYEVSYAVDGTLMNPLEGFYATLAGCAAVFAKKECKALGVAPDGIVIDCKPYAGPGGPLTLAKFKTAVQFPAAFPSEHKAAILDAIRHCAVKQIVDAGAAIDFSVGEVGA